jgi:hypothetical protein
MIMDIEYKKCREHLGDVSVSYPESQMTGKELLTYQDIDSVFDSLPLVSSLHMSLSKLGDLILRMSPARFCLS